MTQQIEIDYQEKQPETNINIETTPKTDESLGDVFDVYGMASKVHSRTTDMTRDYVLANYTTDVINAKFPKFIREQRKTLRILSSYLTISDDILYNKYEKPYADKVKAKIETVILEIEKLLLGELDEMVIISRARKGHVIEAMLLHGKNQEQREDYEQTTEEKTIMNQLFESKKKK